MALGLGLGLPWPLESGAGDLVKIGVYPPSGGPGTLYLATDSPVLQWANVSGLWRPILDGAYLGYAPGANADFPTNLAGWDGHGFVDAELPGVPRWTIGSGQSLAVHSRARAFGAGIGSMVDCVLMAEHQTVGGTNTGQDYGCGLALFSTSTKKAGCIALSFAAGTPNGVALWTCAQYQTGNWATSLTPYTETGGGVRRTGAMVLRAKRTAANVITYYVSRDGIVWEAVGTYDEITMGAVDLVGPTLLSAYNGLNTVGVSVRSWHQI